MSREKQLEEARERLVNLYVANRGAPDHEFISCITPRGASEMTFHQRRQSEVWSAFDDARTILGEFEDKPND